MEYIAIIQGLIIIALLIVILLKKDKKESNTDISEIIESITTNIAQQSKENRKETYDTTSTLISNLSNMINNTITSSGDKQDKNIVELINRVTNNQRHLEERLNKMINGVDNRISNFTQNNEAKLETMRRTIKESLTDIRQENSKKLDEMRNTVDEKLQTTLEDRIGKSFKIVSERLEQVYKGLGEMQTLASGVGDLKKVLTNVKTRGILGEIQLGAILEQILTPEQYDTNVATVKGSKNVVEFAVKLPGNDDNTVYLPIDSKFPGDTYSQLMEAYESGNPDEIEKCLKNLDKVIKLSAKDIRDKYVETPYTTDFAIMFLPFEGLYSEVVRRGLLETLQRDYKVNIAGPTTMAALLNSLQMGFKTLAVQKRSSEVWNILGAVKTEFEKFENVLSATQTRIDQVSKELDKLVGVRTRQINRKLSSITTLSEDDAKSLMATAEE